MKTINYMNGLCGSGKTAFAIKQACIGASLSKEKYAFVVPSIDLQKEYVSRINDFCHSKKIKVDVYAINTTNLQSTSASIDLRNHLESHNGAQILIITQSLFTLNTYWQFSNEWNLYIDEEMEFLYDLTLQFNDPRNLGSQDFAITYLKDVMEVNNQESPFVYFRPNKEVSWQDLEVWSNDDALYGAFKSLNSYISKKNFRIKTTQEYWNTFMNKESKKLYLWAIFDMAMFTKFKSVTIMGADIENSQMSSMLIQAGFDLVPSSHNSNQKHNLKVEINYASHRDTWSVSYYKQSYNNAMSNLDVYMALVKENNREDSILVQNNKNNTWIPELKRVQLPYNAEGLNKEKFTQVHNYSECGAYNFTPERLSIMQIEHIPHADKLQLRRMVLHNYQGFMRSSARTENANKFLHRIFVPTEKIATELKNNFFPNASVQQMTTKNVLYNDFLKNKEVLTNAQLSIRSRVRKNIKKYFVNNPASEENIVFSFYSKVSSKLAENDYSFTSFKEMAEFFESMNRTYTSKNEALLFMNAKANGRTNKDIIQYNPMVVLDIDNSNIEPKKVASILHDANLESIVCSSFNHKKDGINKMRVMIALNESVSNSIQYREVSIAVGEMIYSLIKDTQSKVIFEIDESSYKITQLYYMPGINKEFSDYNFFYYTSGNVIEVCNQEDKETIIIPFVQNNNIMAPILKRIDEVRPHHRDIPYCKIVGYIKNHRQMFSNDMIQQVYQQWVTSADPNKVKCGSFDHFVKTVETS
jgi:hypothetical protein